MANYVTAIFTGGETKAVATGLWQWDYGQTLRVEGLNLPRTLEVHFHQLILLYKEHLQFHNYV